MACCGGYKKDEPAPKPVRTSDETAPIAEQEKLEKKIEDLTTTTDLKAEEVNKPAVEASKEAIAHKPTPVQASDAEAAAAIKMQAAARGRTERAKVDSLQEDARKEWLKFYLAAEDVDGAAEMAITDAEKAQVEALRVSKVKVLSSGSECLITGLTDMKTYQNTIAVVESFNPKKGYTVRAHDGAVLMLHVSNVTPRPAWPQMAEEEPFWTSCLPK